jgi:glycosyltransferase involved in cell wall biosynthesis
VNEALVSVIIPVHNGARYLAATLESVFAQDYRPFEVIVVDDGSTDASAEVARRYDVRLLQQPQQGQVVARNSGVAAAQGEFLALLDADDLWRPDKLSRQLARFAARPELEISVTLIQNFWSDELAAEAARMAKHARGGPLPGYCGSTPVIRRRTFERIGRFDTRLAHSATTAWFVRARDGGAVDELLPEVLVDRRMHAEGISRVNNQRSTDEHLALLKQTLDRRRAAPHPPSVG